MLSLMDGARRIPLGPGGNRVSPDGTRCLGRTRAATRDPAEWLDLFEIGIEMMRQAERRAHGRDRSTLRGMVVYADAVLGEMWRDHGLTAPLPADERRRTAE